LEERVCQLARDVANIKKDIKDMNKNYMYTKKQQRELIAPMEEQLENKERKLQYY